MSNIIDTVTDDNIIEVDRSLVCPILNFLYQDGESDEAVRTKASNALLLRSVVTAFIAGPLALGAYGNAEEVYECRRAVYYTYLSLITFLACCLARDALCILPVRMSSHPRLLVDRITARQVLMDGALLGIGLPASVYLIFHDRSDSGCRSVNPTFEWSITVGYFALFLSSYYAILVAMGIRLTGRLLGQLYGKVLQRRAI